MKPGVAQLPHLLRRARGEGKRLEKSLRDHIGIPRVRLNARPGGIQQIGQCARLSDAQDGFPAAQLLEEFGRHLKLVAALKHQQHVRAPQDFLRALPAHTRLKYQASMS